MWAWHPYIELKGFQRLRNLERRIFYSPVVIIVTLIGLAGGAYVLWNLRRGIEEFPKTILIGYGTFVVHYLGLMVYLFGYRFRHLKCPGCGQVMQAFLADMDEGTWRRFIQAFEIGGRYYRRPYDEDDRRPWVRLMQSVRACRHCRTYVNCSHIRFETCTEEELAQLQQRLPNA
jgi:hypothetical protein